MDSNTIIVGYFNTTLNEQIIYSKINTPLNGQIIYSNINKETVALNDTQDQMGLTDILRTFYPKAAEYTFYCAHKKFSTIDHILRNNQP